MVLMSPEVAVELAGLESQPACLSRLAGGVGQHQGWWGQGTSGQGRELGSTVRRDQWEALEPLWDFICHGDGCVLGVLFNTQGKEYS